MFLDFFNNIINGEIDLDDIITNTPDISDISDISYIPDISDVSDNLDSIDLYDNETQISEFENYNDTSSSSPSFCGKNYPPNANSDGYIYHSEVKYKDYKVYKKNGDWWIWTANDTWEKITKFIESQKK